MFNYPSSEIDKYRGSSANWKKYSLYKKSFRKSDYEDQEDEYDEYDDYDSNTFNSYNNNKENYNNSNS